jgi:hypothetical protein
LRQSRRPLLGSGCTLKFGQFGTHRRITRPEISRYLERPCPDPDPRSPGLLCSCSIVGTELLQRDSHSGASKRFGQVLPADGTDRDGPSITIMTARAAFYMLAGDKGFQQRLSFNPAGPRYPITLASLAGFRRIYPEQTDTHAAKVQRVPVNRTRIAVRDLCLRDFRRGRQRNEKQQDEPTTHEVGPLPPTP